MLLDPAPFTIEQYGWGNSAPAAVSIIVYLGQFSDEAAARGVPCGALNSSWTLHPLRLNSMAGETWYLLQCLLVRKLQICEMG